MSMLISKSSCIYFALHHFGAFLPGPDTHARTLIMSLVAIHYDDGEHTIYLTSHHIGLFGTTPSSHILHRHHILLRIHPISLPTLVSSHLHLQY